MAGFFRCFRPAHFALVLACGFSSALAQQPDAPPRRDARPEFDGPPPFDRDGPRPDRGPGGPGGPGFVQEEVKLVSRFDKDGDSRLNSIERQAARKFLAEEKAAGRGPRRPGRRGRNENEEPPTPGRKLSPADVKSYAETPLFDSQTVRTFFLEFENADWEKELADFYHSDVEVPAKLTVDGKTYPEVGVHFRGASSFFTVAEGRKRSLSLSLNFAREDQRLAGYRNVDLLNSHADPTYLRTILYYQIAREYIPAPKASYSRVVINGESWGVYVSVQHFDKDFVHEWFPTSKGARWKVPGSPRGSGGLKYIGESVADYRKHYEIKSKDDPKAWSRLIRLCRVLNETPENKLEAALAPLLDIDGALKFLALENVFINNDGYWIRSSDYSLCEDEKGRFHLVPHDANETFSLPGGPGGGPRVTGVALEPLAGADDPNKPLLHKLLAVPSLRTRYLGYVREMGARWLDWNKLQPLAQRHQSLITAELKTDTRSLFPVDAVTRGVTEDIEGEGPRGPRRGISLKSFTEQRREFLLSHPDIKSAAKK